MKKVLKATTLSLALASTLFADTASANYEVKSGDTMSKIAIDHGTSLQKLSELNPQISNINLIYPGQVLNGIGSKVRYSPYKKSNQSSYKTINQSQQQQQQQQRSSGRTMYVEATAYTAYCYGCSGITATGIDARKGGKIIAVDPRVIPLGSKVYVEGYGTAIAGDTGGAIKGNRIDILVPSEQEAVNWGRRTVKITVLN